MFVSFVGVLLTVFFAAYTIIQAENFGWHPKGLWFTLAFLQITCVVAVTAAFIAAINLS